MASRTAFRDGSVRADRARRTLGRGNEGSPVAIKITDAMTYDFDVESVFAMYLDPAFVVHKNEATGGVDIDVSINVEGELAVVTASRRLPAQIPSYARRFTGDSISMTETDTWEAPADDGARVARVHLAFHGLPVTAGGRFTLEANAPGSVCRIEVEMKASVPVIGRKVEQVAHDYFVKAIRKEEILGQQWLADH